MAKPFQHTSNALRFAVCLCCLVQCVLGITSSCFTSVAVIGKNATVTCKFAEDVGTLRRDFSVFKYPLGTNNFQDAENTRVVGCVWGANPSPECADGSGFSLRNSYSSTIIVDVPEVTEDTEGLYVCQLVLGSQTADTSPASCNLTVSNASSIAREMDSVSKEGKQCDGLSVLEIVLIILLGLALLGYCIILVKCREKILTRCRQLNRGQASSGDTPNNAPEKTEVTPPTVSTVAAENAEPEEETSSGCLGFLNWKKQGTPDVEQPPETVPLKEATKENPAPTGGAQ